MQSGTQLGHYTILSALGKGGMGEVWRARDTKLGREVAIKTLPEAFARDLDRLARFEREARLLASLNHPNIAAIYGLEESNGTRFLVLELVEGDTLADQLKRGPIPVEESLKLALQIAEALEAAHEKGVIHRDLKPANIKVTPDGKVKVLDFGLAKAFASDDADASLSNSPTLSMAATQQGVILGTAAYMSPEQARGETIDKRADIWAFGCVLFEILTGKRTWTGRTVTDVIGGIVAREPDWTPLPANLHPRIRFLLERCLEKEAKDRSSRIADARVEIQEVLADPNGVVARSLTGVGQAAGQSKLPWIAAVMGIIVAGVAGWNLKPAPAPPPVTRFTHELPESLSANLGTYFVAISPTDDKFVYATTDGLYLRRMNEFEARLIPGTEGEDSARPFFSPDGVWVGYFSLREGQLKKVLTDGGAPVHLADADNAFGPFWAANGSILYAERSSGRIMEVSENGGEPSVLVEVEDLVRNPVMLPGGNSLLFTVGAGNERQVVARSLDNGNETTLFADATGGLGYLASGHLVYAVENDIFARSFDAETWEVGSQVPMLQDIFRLNSGSAPQFHVSNSGSLVYLPGQGGFGVTTLIWVDREGNSESVLDVQEGRLAQPRLSPDYQQVSVSVTNPSDLGDHVWIYELDRGSGYPLTGRPSTSSLWSPDGASLAYRDEDSGAVMIRSTDGSGEPQPITEHDAVGFPTSWSSDGTLAVMVRRGTTGSRDIDMVSVGGESVQFLSDEFDESLPTFSPNGDWVAYVSTESGERQVYLAPLTGTAGKVSLAQGDEPLWADNGELFFRTQEGNMMAVGISTAPELQIGDPRILFEDRFLRGGQRNYDVTPDGQRLLMVEGGESEAGQQINVVLNWFEELKERAPVP